MALELAILTTFVIVLLLVVVAFGRVTHGRQLVDDAAAAGARAAALASTPALATSQATTAVTNTLTQAGISCQDTQVSTDTTAFGPGGQVTVTVACTSQLSGLALTGLPGTLNLHAVSTVPLETFRDFGGTP